MLLEPAPAITGMRSQEIALTAGTESTLDLAVGGQIGNVPLNQYIGLYLSFRLTELLLKLSKTGKVKWHYIKMYQSIDMIITSIIIF